MAETGDLRGPMLPPGTFAGRVAIVTGGGTGLGYGIARDLLALGARVVIASRRQEVLDKAAEELAAYGEKPLTVSMDVRQPDQVDHMVMRALETYGRVDYLVNNAAGNFPVRALDLSVNGWNAVVNIVLNGTWYCTQRVAKEWVAANRPGAVVNIVATYAWTGGPYVVHSAAAKAGVLALTKSLAGEWAPHHIRVNAIAPGPIADTGAADHLWPTPEAAAAVLKGIPAGRFGRREEVAHLTSYLLSDYADFVSGACFTVDGASSLGKGDFLPTRV
jgi:NAD(P)-dependent dehydrogenase (short-subunit alcohol dehydrogenase family)